MYSIVCVSVRCRQCYWNNLNSTQYTTMGIKFKIIKVRVKFHNYTPLLPILYI